MVMRKSPFPVGFLGVDLFYGGAWQPLGADVDQSPVSLSHGARSESGSADVSSLTFTVTNADGKYSPRNPVSPLYGLVGRNTPARARVSLGAPWLDLEAPLSRATTPDVAAHDITGDIDIRWYGERDSWRAWSDLMSKYGNSGQRSYLFFAEADGRLSLLWTANGSTVLSATSSVPVPAWAGRIALRATMDVNNGAAGRTIRFYYSSDLASTWIQLGADIVQAGTTSIFNSTAPLQLGSDVIEAAQRVYGWELRNGINGTVVSSRTVSALTVGATSFTDAQGRTWTVTSGRVSNTHTLAVCEVAEWPVDWNTKGAPSVLTEVQAAGVRRRLGQGAQPLDSVLYRAISRVTENVVAYWPMEDGSDARNLGAAVGPNVMHMSTAVDPGAYEAFRGSAPLPVIHAGGTRAVVPFYPNTGRIQVRWVQWVPPAGLPADATLLRIDLVGGTIGAIDLRMRTTGEVGVFGYDHDGAEMSGSTFVAGSIEGTQQRMSMEINQNGSLVFWRRSTLEPGQSLGTTYGQDFTFAHVLGRVGQVRINPNRVDFGDIAIGHVSVATQITGLFDGADGEVLVGHTGEAAADRTQRLAEENGLPVSVRGTSSATMGEQEEETLLDLLAQAEAADGGILHDDMRALGLRYRTLHSMGDQPAVTVPYDDNRIIPFRPSDDDALTRNRVTVQRTRGAKITHEVTEGPMSTQPAPAGVGLYDTSLTLNLSTDDLADRTASWLVHVGTWDEGRYPVLGVDLAHPYLLANPELTQRLLALTPGDRLVITDPPPWLPPRDVDVIVRGITADITPHHLRLQWACVPARPHRIARWNAGHRYSGTGTALSAAVTSTDTSLPLDLPDYVTWTHADGDYDIVVGGEVMTVRNVDANVLPDPTLRVQTMSSNGATGTTTRPTTGGPTPGAPTYFRYAVITPNTLSPMSTAMVPGGLGGIPVVPGQQWTGSFYARKSAGGPAARFDVTWYDAAGATLSSAGSAATSIGTSWQRLVHTFTVPAGAAFARPVLVWTGIALAGQTLDWSSAQFELGAVATTFATTPSMTVTRSVNGVVKAHPAGAAVALADPSFYAR